MAFHKRGYTVAVLSVTCFSCTEWALNNLDHSGGGSAASGSTLGQVEATQDTSDPSPTSLEGKTSTSSSLATDPVDSTSSTSTMTMPETATHDPAVPDLPMPTTRDVTSEMMMTNDTFEEGPADPLACDAEKGEVYVDGDMSCAKYEEVWFVFVTSEEYTGNLSYDVCNTLNADATGEPGYQTLPGQYWPWVSGGFSPADWMFPVDKNRRYVKYDRVVGGNSATVVASDWASLLESMLVSGVDVTEFGEKVVGDDEYAWTGTNASGEATGNNCYGWTDEVLGFDNECDEPDNIGTIGKIGSSNSAWVNVHAGGCGMGDLEDRTWCNQKHRIYCVQTMDL